MIPLFKVFMHPSASRDLTAVLNSGYIGEGPKSAEFEEAFSKLTSLPVSLVNSGTSAIDLALHMYGIGAGDEVITTPITCTATNGHILHRKAKIVWADVNPHTGLIDPEDVRRKITSKTKLIIAVNWGGSMPDYAALKSFGIPVLEDAAHGPYYTEKSRGDAIVWSFQAIKFLTTGDGGALYIQNKRRAELLRWFGLDRKSSASFRCDQNIQEIGYKYQINDIASTLGLINIQFVPDLIYLHRQNAKAFEQFIVNAKIQKIPFDPESTYWIYTLLTEKPREFMAYLKEKGIDSSPVHARNDKHDAFGGYDYSLEGVNYFDSRQVSIPVHWGLTYADRESIIAAVNSY